MALQVTVVGVGLVGETIVECLRDRDFPCEWPPRVAATRERSIQMAGETLTVEETSAEVFEGADLVLFAGKEGARGASRTWRETAEGSGAVCIDNGRDFRMASDVPLLVPEVNAHELDSSPRFIASPNCSTIQLVMVLDRLRTLAPIHRVHVATYQSTSGWGSRGPDELRSQTAAGLQSLDDIPFDPSVFPRPAAFNVIPHIEPFLDDDYTREELKLVLESRKILSQPELLLSATAVRVPTFVGHGEAVWIETSSPIDPKKAQDVLRDSPGIRLVDEPRPDNPREDPNERTYPVVLDAGRYPDDVLVGRVRRDLANPNGLLFWCVSDNLRKGAALNVVQIAEELVKRGCLRP